MANNSAGRATKVRLADEFMRLTMTLPPQKITVCDLVERVGIDRQTFYYHFGSMYRLASYAYDLSVARMFDVEKFEDIYRNYNVRTHCERIVRGLAGKQPGMRETALFLNESNARGTSSRSCAATPSSWLSIGWKRPSPGRGRGSTCWTHSRHST